MGFNPKRQEGAPASQGRVSTEQGSREAKENLLQPSPLGPQSGLSHRESRPGFLSCCFQSSGPLTNTITPDCVTPSKHRGQGWTGPQCQPPATPSACPGAPTLLPICLVSRGPAFSPHRCHDSAAPGWLRQERGGCPGVDEGRAGSAAGQRQHPGAPRCPGGQAAGDRGTQRHSPDGPWPWRGPSLSGLRFPAWTSVPQTLMCLNVVRMLV